MNFKNPGAAVAAPGVEAEHHAAAFAGTQAAALQYAGGTPDSSSNCLRACGTARCACLQGKALRAIPAARGLAPLDTTEPAAPDRPRSTPRRWAVLGGCAGACCGRLCECVPSATLAARCLCVTKDGSRIRRPAVLLGSMPRCKQGRPHGQGRVPAGRWGMALPVSESVPVKPSCGDAVVAMTPFGLGWFGPRRPCVVVNPGGGAGFMSATFQPK